MADMYSSINRHESSQCCELASIGTVVFPVNVFSCTLSSYSNTSFLLYYQYIVAYSYLYFHLYMIVCIYIALMTHCCIFVIFVSFPPSCVIYIISADQLLLLNQYPEVIRGTKVSPSTTQHQHHPSPLYICLSFALSFIYTYLYRFIWCIYSLLRNFSPPCPPPLLLPPMYLPKYSKCITYVTCSWTRIHLHVHFLFTSKPWIFCPMRSAGESLSKHQWRIHSNFVFHRPLWCSNLFNLNIFSN